MPPTTPELEHQEEEREQDEYDETEHDEPAGDDELEQPAEPEPHPGEGLEEPSDAMIAELQAACDTHHDHVHAIMGPFVDGFVPCETCNGIGLAYPTPTGPRLEPAPGLDRCEVCKGPGELKTPSTRSGFDVIQCTRCNGQGYVGTLAIPSAGQAVQAVESFPAAPGQTPAPPAPQQPSSTDPRVQQLRDEGFIVLEKPNA